MAWLGEGAVALSLPLPVRAEPYGAAEARPYFEGLLPDGMRRERFARELGLDPADTLGLLAELGRDCPGAVVVLPEGGDGEPLRADPDALSWIEEEEIAELVEIPPTRLLDPLDEQRMRFALPGEGHRIALVHLEGTSHWAWPRPGIPSTHIIEPETGEHPDFAINRAACAEALRGLGLPAAPLQLMMVAGTLTTLTRRFDRRGDGLDAVRTHHETLWQALGFPPGAERREREADRFGFCHSAGLLREAVGEQAVETIFKLGLCSFLLGDHADDIVGRRDLHGRHVALSLDGERPALTPFHGIASTDVYESDEDTVRTAEEWLEHTSGFLGLRRVGSECGFMPQQGLKLGLATATELTGSLGAVAERAREEGWYRPVIDEILLLVTRRSERLIEELSELVPAPDDRGRRD